MRPHVISFFLLLIVTSLNAQREFAPSGATWYYGFFDSAFGIPLFSGYEEMRYDRDTIIDNQTCKVLTRRRVGEVDDQLIDYYTSEKIIYQDGYKIYSWAEEQFFMIYDFGVMENDTVRFSGGNSFSDSCYTDYRVDSIYYELIDDVPLKNIRLQTIGSTSGGYTLINEKFGALPLYLFDIETFCVLDNGHYLNFRCYEDDEFAHYQADTTACDAYNNISQVIDLEKTGISIYPNPIEDLFLLKNTSGDTYDLTVFNIDGQLMYQSFGIKDGQQEVDCTTWLPGTYVVQLKIGEQRAYQKLLKPN